MTLLFYILEVTDNNPIAVSILTVLHTVPILIFSIIGGVFADRWIPKKTMIYADIFSVISVVGAMFLVYLGYWQAVFFISFIAAVVGQFSGPSSLKVIKRNLEKESINIGISLSQTLNSLFIILGPVIGTVVYEIFKINALYILIVLYSCSLLLLIRLPIEDYRETIKTHIWIDFKDGIKYIWQIRQLKTIAIAFLIAGLSVGLYVPLEVFIVTERLLLDKEFIQYFITAEGIGMLTGAIGVGVISRKIKVETIIQLTLFILSISIVLQVLSSFVVFTLLIRFIGGFFLGMMHACVSIIIMNTVEDKFIARANGVITPLFTATSLIGSALGGPIMHTTSLYIVFILSSIIMLISALYSLSFNKRKIDKDCKKCV
jgi:predicted MFS family arabinose efflux permease